MSAPAGGGGGDGKSEGTTILWVIFGIMAIIFILWYFFKEQLVWLFLKIRLYEFMLVNFFVNQTEVNNGIIWLKSAIPEDLLSNTVLFTNISEVMGRYFMYPSVFLIISTDRRFMAPRVIPPQDTPRRASAQVPFEDRTVLLRHSGAT